MTTKLRDLTLSELSFVNKAANKHAKIAILKRDVPITKSSGTFEVEVSFNSLVQKRMLEHGEDEPTATVKIAETTDGKRLYREAVFAQDLQIAKSTTLMTFEKRMIEKIGGRNADERAVVTDAWAQLDKLAKNEANRTGEPFYQAYARILTTSEGSRLYSLGCNKPSIAGGATA